MLPLHHTPFRLAIPALKAFCFPINLASALGCIHRINRINQLVAESAHTLVTIVHVFTIGLGVHLEPAASAVNPNHLYSYKHHL